MKTRDIAMTSLLLAGIAVPAFPEVGESPTALSFGLGAGRAGFMGKLSYGFPRGNTYYMVRVAGVEELKLFGPAPTDSTVDFGVLIGKTHKTSLGFASAGIGLGVVHSVRTVPNYGAHGSSIDVKEKLTVGVPFSAKVVLGGSVVGVGSSALAASRQVGHSSAWP